MREGGQIFTFDMLLALILVMLIVTTSGLAITLARKRASGYVSRYSLERTASDAADVLVRSPGKPRDWADELGELKIPGLAETEDNSDESVPNLVDSEKIGQLVRITTGEYWDPSKPEVQAVRKLFGGTNNFEVEIYRGNESLWHFWPGWDEEDSSGAENSLEVATASRVVYTRTGDIRYRSDPIVRVKPGAGTEVRNKENFYIYDGELESFDWYVVIETSNREENRPREIEVKIKTGGQLRYTWKPPQTGKQTKKVFPDFHGGMENDSPPPPPQVGINDMDLKVWQDPSDKESGQWAQIFIIGVPQCSQPETALQSLERITATLKIMVWR